MSERSGIFAGEDPFELCRSWLREAEAVESSDANAISLASVDADGLPNVRIVLLKSIEKDSFVFYTNYESKKGTELIESGKAAFVLYWKSLYRQVRVRGSVEKEEGALADAYYESRHLQSRLGAWASAQSQPLASRQDLMDQVEFFKEKFADAPPRPPHWGGFRIKPVEMEFWAGGDYRLHDRFRWTRAIGEDRWSITRLSP